MSDTPGKWRQTSNKMIIRKQKIKLSAEEVSIQVSYGLADVKKAMKDYYAMFSDMGKAYALSLQHTERDVIHYLQHATFAHYVPKYREQLSAWCFAMAVRHNFLISSIDNENSAKKTYFLSESLGAKVGRPRNDDMEDWD